MTISFDTARKIAEALVPDGFALVEDATREEPDGWYLYCQTREFLETGDPMTQAVGSAGMIVNKNTGEVLELGSRFDVDRHLRVYRDGIHQEQYDVVVTKVLDADATVAHLLKLPLIYVVPEVEHGTTWRIPKDYTPPQLHELLRRLPAIFPRVSIFHSYEEFAALRDSGACEVELRRPAEEDAVE